MVHKYYPEIFKVEVFQWVLICTRVKFNKDVKILVINKLSNLLKNENKINYCNCGKVWNYDCYIKVPTLNFFDYLNDINLHSFIK